MSKICKCIFHFLILILAMWFILPVPLIYGATTGKIDGRVTDSQTGDGIPGVNVVIPGTYVGCASDEDGFYVILNVNPGSHDLKFQCIGYTAVTITDVEVTIDLTTTIDVAMQSEVLGLQEVVAVAQRPVVKQDISNSRLDINAESIENLPVQSISNVVGLQAGIEGMTIRGSSSDQSVFLVDGISLNDERNNIPYTSVSLSSVREIQVQTGGFNAEYGNARSGVINVVTREGQNDRYSGQATFRMTPPAYKHRGPSVYSPDSYFTRAYTDPEVCWTGTNNGTWDRYEQLQFASFEGFNNLSHMWLTDEDPTNDLSPSAIQRLWQWHHRRQGDIKKPDYTIDAGFGGPVPYLNEKLGNLRFFASYFRLQEMYILPLIRDSYDEENFQLKLTSDINKQMKLTLTGMYGGLFSVCPDQWEIAPSGSVLHSAEGIADRAGVDEVIYMPDYYTPTDIFRKQVAAKFTHILSETAFYEASISYLHNRYHTYATADRDTTARYEIFNGFYVDEAPYGYYPPLSEASPGGQLALGGWMGFGRDSSTVATTTMKFDYTNQIDKFNQLKTGFEFVMTDYDIHSSLYHPYSMQWNHRLDRTSNPYRLGLYIQDKMEFESLVVNGGLRFDYSNANSNWYSLAPYDTLLTSQYGDAIEELADQEESEPIFAVSPRLGISHPITADSKLYFNYGHFYSLPSSEYRFQLDRSGFGQVKYLGNPSLPYSKTVAYELGYEQNVFNRYLLKLAAYYKDIVDQPSWTTYVNADETIGLSRAGTDSYEDIRGFEITLRKDYGNWFYGFVNYTYMVQTSGYFGVRYLYENRSEQMLYEKNNPYQERPLPQPFFRTNLNFHVPRDFGLIGDWNLNVLATWKAGATSTYNPAMLPNVIDNVQYKDYVNVDLRLSKRFNIRNTGMEFFVDINNALNSRHFSAAGYFDSNDRIAYMESLHFDWEEGIEHGDDRIGEYRDWDVEYVPMQQTGSVQSVSNPEARVLYYDLSNSTYFQFRDGVWVKRSKGWVRKEVLDTKAYIDMPNLTYFTFLNPFALTFGLKISF